VSRRLPVASGAALALGVGLMIPFDHPLTLALGVACLFAFIVLGVFGLLTPERLGPEAEGQDRR